jgi:DinB superfamily
LKTTLKLLSQTQILLERFNVTIDDWITELDKHSFEELLRKPEDMWSLGQVYVHIIGDTLWYLEQIRLAIDDSQFQNEPMHPNGRLMFINNSFPNERMENPANDGMPQPVSKEILRAGLAHARLQMNEIFQLFPESKMKGKSKHPGLGYFSALEWLQFADMHMRHHLRQRKRILLS